MAGLERVADRLTQGERSRAWLRLHVGSWDPGRRAPVAAAIALVLGLSAVAMLTPIAGRGDYGQWLMTSRYYLGEPIPGYRDVPALPPFVPVLLALIRLVIPDAILALSVLNAALLVALAATFYLLGWTLLRTPWAGVISMTCGFLVTDRFLELFAFGGLLQSAAITFMGLSVVGFVRAARAPTIERRWWAAGTLCLALAMLSHVATGLIAVPMALSVAGVAALAHGHLGPRPIAVALLPVLAGLLVGGLYWVLVLIPAGADYVTNPASLAYRGPDRLFSSLFSYWPTSAVVVLGAGAIGLGSLNELLQRRIGGHLVLLIWLGVAWGSLAYSMASGAATDYPRFATVLLAPLVVGAASAIVWIIGTLAAQARDLRPSMRAPLMTASAALLMVAVAAPFAVPRYARQSEVYQPRDAASLTAAVEWVDASLGAYGGSVLTDVRDGKWLEGLTGREALFSLPVRYAFRPGEWRRSLEADALLRSTTTLTSGLISGMFINRAANGEAQIPSDLLVRVNHGGEFVDMLRLSPASIEIRGRSRRTTAAQLEGVRGSTAAGSGIAELRTVWASPEWRRGSLTQTTTTWADGAALRILLQSKRNQLAAAMVPPGGSTWTVTDLAEREATVCLALVGEAQPCARIWVGPATASLTVMPEGGVRVANASRSKLEIVVTALTAGERSVDLAVLEPAQVVANRNVRAALLWSEEPAYEERVRRLEAIGFRTAATFGPYQVLLLQ